MMHIKIKSFLLNNLDIIVFIVFIFLKAFLFETQIETAYIYYLPKVYIALTASLLVIISFSLLFKKKKRLTYLLIFDFIISLLLIVDTNYYRYFRDVISIPVIRNGLMLGAVKTSIGSLVKPWDFLYFIDFFFIVFFIIKYRNVKLREYHLRFKLLAFFLLLIIGGVTSGLSIYKLQTEQPTLLKTMYNRVYVAKELGAIDYHCIDLYNFIESTIYKNQPLPKAEEDKIKAYFSAKGKELSQGTNLKGIARGKNLIIIQVEALQQFVINKSIDGKEITPNLNKWLKSCTYFDNYFYQVSSGGTSDAELMTNNSIYPAPSGAAYYLYSSNTFNSLGNILKGVGYNTNVLHGYFESFWNRNIMYKAESFDKFYSQKDYNIDETVGMGLSDKSFLKQSIDKLNKLKNPYYSFVITLSSHFPFDDVKDYGDFNTGNLNSTLLENYIKAIHYTDTQLGTFLDELQANGTFDNSIVVLYGDHNAISKDNETYLENFLGINKATDLNWMQLQKVPMMIHFPKEEYKGINHTYSGQMDLLPTLLNLYNLNSNYIFGKDLFNTNKNAVVFRNGSFTDGSAFYLSQSDSYYDIKTGEKLKENATLLKEKTEAINSLQYSDELLQHNLIKKLGK
ncbi:MAG TPA: LTA synthase family protein [Clostridiaceae bacterium]